MRTLALLFVASSIALAGGADGPAALLKKGEAKKAAEEAERLAKADAKNIDAWLVLADALLAQGAPDQAWDKIEPAIDANPKEARLCMKLADIFIRMAEDAQLQPETSGQARGYYADARRWYHDASKLDPKSADAIYGEAFAAYWLSELDDARKLLADALAVNPSHGKTHLFQAEMFYREKKYAEAETKFESALKLDDSDPVMCLHYGHALFAQGKNDQAKAAYIRTLKRHPTYEAAILSGLLYLVNKDYSKAVPILLEATKEAGNSGPLWFYVGFAYTKAKASKDAEAAFRKSLEIAPNDARTLHYLGLLLEENGDRAGAFEQYKRSLRANADYVDPASRIQSMILAEDDIDAREKLFEELIRLAPNQAWILNNYALVLRDWAEARGAHGDENPPTDVKRRIGRSAEIYEKAAALAPEDPQIQSDTGLLFDWYPCIRDDRKAFEYFKRSLDLSGHCYRDAFDGLARVCRRTKDWETLAEYAGGVVQAIEEGGIAIAPIGGNPPAEHPGETPGLRARAEAALREARANLK